MWNQATCNKVITKKSLQKEKARLLQSLRNTKSTLRDTNHRPTFKSCTKKPYEQRHLQIYKQNKMLATRIESICKLRISKSMQKVKASTSLLKMIDNNKRKVNSMKNKQLQQANKKMLSKIVHVSSSLASIRLKTLFNDPTLKPKTIITNQNLNKQTLLKDYSKITRKIISPLQNSQTRKFKTELSQSVQVSIQKQNAEQVEKKQKIKCNTEQNIQQQYVMDEEVIQQQTL